MCFYDSLGDSDDDVRAVAATCLLPVTTQLVEQLPSELPRVLAVLWMCLGDMKDDLNSSVGAVMDLLGKGLVLELYPILTTYAYRAIGWIYTGHSNTC